MVVFIVLSSIITIGMLTTAYSGSLHPSDFPKLAVFGMSYPIFLILQLIVVFGWLLFKRWKIAIVFALPFVLCAKAVFIFCPLNIIGNSVPDSEKKSEFKLMTYNIRNFYDYFERPTDHNLTVDNLLSVDADIVCMQECQTTTDDPTITQQQHIDVRDRYPYSNFKSYDVGILSKYPILSGTDLSKGHYAAAKYEVDIKGDTVTIFTVHLQSIGLNDEDKKLYREITSPKKASEKMDSVKNVIGEVKVQLYRKLKDAMQKRAEQAEYLRKELDKVKGRVILCGDFNDTPNSFAYRTIKGDMTDAYVDCGFGPCITYNANRFYFRIDHVFYDGKIEAVDVNRPKFDSSDHYPLVVDFVIKK